MSAEESFLTLKTFFESRSAAKQAMATISEGVEIGVVIGGSVECAIFRKGEEPVVEARPAATPDVVFYIRPESIDILATQTQDDISDIGIGIFKEILAGNIQIKVPGKIWNLLSRGYLEMLKRGGAPVLSFLTERGLTSFAKIVDTIKSFKS